MILDLNSKSKVFIRWIDLKWKDRVIRDFSRKNTSVGNRYKLKIQRKSSYNWNLTFHSWGKWMTLSFKRDTKKTYQWLSVIFKWCMDTQNVFWIQNYLSSCTWLSLKITFLILYWFLTGTEIAGKSAMARLFGFK